MPGETLAAFAQYSRFVQRIRRRYAEHLHGLPPGPPVHALMQETFEALCGPFPKLGDALRVLRQLVMERLVVLDCEHQAPLEAVTRAMTELAEFSLDMAYREASAQLQR